MGLLNTYFYFRCTIEQQFLNTTANWPLYCYIYKFLTASSFFILFSSSLSLSLSRAELCTLFVSLSSFLPNLLSLSVELSLHHNAKAAPARPGKSKSELSSLFVDRFARESLHKRYEIPKLFILIWCQSTKHPNPCLHFCFMQVIHEDTNKVPVDFYL